MTQTLNTKEHTDIKRLAWVEHFLPPLWRPYAYLMRLDRPIGIWLLFLPCLWGIFLAADGITALNTSTSATMTLFFVGAIIMRGAGCVMNDLWDRDLDKMVERTKNRPIACGNVNVKQGIIFLCSLLIIGLLILIQFNALTIILGIATLPLIAIYPLMKRITWWPQLFLGITFNFGILMGYSAINGNLSIPVITLYLCGIFWTIGYDTIYAQQDKEDDALAGIKSTARMFDGQSKIWVGGFYALSIIFLFATMTLTNDTTLHFVLIVFPISHFCWQLLRWNLSSPASALMVFKSNLWTGLLIMLCLA